MKKSRKKILLIVFPFLALVFVGLVNSSEKKPSLADKAVGKDRTVKMMSKGLENSFDGIRISKDRKSASFDSSKFSIKRRNESTAEAKISAAGFKGSKKAYFNCSC